jgi:hypothetical protein
LAVTIAFICLIFKENSPRLLFFLFGSLTYCVDF